MEVGTVFAQDLAAMLGDRLRQESRKRQVTNEQMADLLGVNPVTYSRWLNGHSVPGEENLGRIAELLGLSIERLRREMTVPVTGPRTLGRQEARMLPEVSALLWNFERLSAEAREAVIDFAQRLRLKETQPDPPEDPPDLPPDE